MFWRRACFAATLAGLLIVLPASADAETCTMYQKYVKESGAGTLCANQGGNFREVTASGGGGTYYARKVPKCDADGTDTSCVSNFVKSLDGTRAFYHIDPNPASGSWVIYLDGGGSCGAMAGLNAAEACFSGAVATVGFNGYDNNIGDAFEMTTRHASGAYTVRNRKTGTGILSPSGDNPYAYHNRVWVNKSSFDRFMGNVADNTQTYTDGDEIELYFHGRRIIQSLIKDLARSNGPITVGVETVPDLASADSILFVAESGGAGGLIHNAEWLKARIADVSPQIKVNFAMASRMLPWVEAEAYFSAIPGSIWDERFSGTTTIEKNPAASGSDVAVTYSEDAFRPAGAIRALLDSWGDATSVSAPFLDDSCKAVHPDKASMAFKCYDEGHVALYHMDENVFFFESLFDGVHEGDGSPVLFMETADDGTGPVPLDPGFVWNPSGTESWTQARINRVLYTIDAILLNPAHRGARGFYAPAVNAHTLVKNPGFYANVLYPPNAVNPAWSFGQALEEWENENNFGLCGSPGCDYAVIEDRQSDYQITYSSGIMGGGWLQFPACPLPCLIFPADDSLASVSQSAGEGKATLPGRGDQVR